MSQPAASRRPKSPRQLQLALRQRGRGGARANAGRKKGPRVSHHPREGLASRFPVHVTLRVLPAVWNLRGRLCFRALRGAFASGRRRAGFRLVHFSVQGNHLHLVVEAADERALARGMQGLAVRMAKGLNREMGRGGPVFADRYHAHILRSLAEVRNAVAYVLGNFAKHLAGQGRSAGSGFVDPCSSDWPGAGELVAPPQTWLLSGSG